MRRIIVWTIALVIGFISFAVSAENPVTLYPTPEPDSSTEPVDLKDKGRRTAPVPIMVVVDVEAGTITGTSPLLDGIVRYEIWNADGDLCIASASDAATALKAINGCHGTYLLRLRGDGYSLKGYITL